MPAGCEIYENRPILCRMFGASEEDLLKCPHGYKADKLLTAKKSRQIVRIYTRIIYGKMMKKEDQ